jgi:hypothetical protein
MPHLIMSISTDWTISPGEMTQVFAGSDIFDVPKKSVSCLLGRLSKGPPLSVTTSPPAINVQEAEYLPRARELPNLTFAGTPRSLITSAALLVAGEHGGPTDSAPLMT